MLKHYDYQEAQELFHTKEVLTVEEADLCFDLIPVRAKEYLFYNEYTNTYLNLYIYSELEQDNRQFEMETGIEFKFFVKNLES
jgi:hypothetical protein